MLFRSPTLGFYWGNNPCCNYHAKGPVAPQHNGARPEPDLLPFLKGTGNSIRFGTYPGVDLRRGLPFCVGVYWALGVTTLEWVFVSSRGSTLRSEGVESAISLLFLSASSRARFCDRRRRPVHSDPHPRAGQSGSRGVHAGTGREDLANGAQT